MLSLVLLQFVLPLALLVWTTVWPARSWLSLAFHLSAAVAVTVALISAGVWLFPPWWVAWAFAALFFAAGLRTSVASLPVSPLPRTFRGWLGALLLASLTIYSGQIAGEALLGRRAPAGLVPLAFPLSGGTFLVVNGGSNPTVNAHRLTADPKRNGYAAYRGQSYGVDFVQLNSWGGTWSGLSPRRPQDHAIYGAEVLAPCAGAVLVAVDGVEDTAVGIPDRAHMAGNHVLIGCGTFEVLLGHLAPGSVRVRVGSVVTTSDVVGRVGNTGNTGAPHLHVHAQRFSRTRDPLAGDPLPITLDGRFLVRGDRVRRP